MAGKPKSLKIVTKELKSLTRNKTNARKHPQSQLDSLKKILLKVGQRTPLVVDSDDVVRKGNGTHMALEQLVAEGHKQFERVGVLVTDLKGSDLIAWEIADNKIGDQSEWDLEQLGYGLRELEKDIDYDIELTGMTLDEIDSTLDDLEKALGDEEILSPPPTQPVIPSTTKPDAPRGYGSSGSGGGGGFKPPDGVGTKAFQVQREDDIDPSAPPPSVMANDAPTIDQSAPSAPGVPEIKQIVLLYDANEFPTIQQNLKRVRKLSESPDNSAAVAWMLNDYASANNWDGNPPKEKQ